MIPRPNLGLEGRKGLVTGIANESSIAWGCAKAFRSIGADLAVTYLNDKAKPLCRAAGTAARRPDPHAARPARRWPARGRLRARSTAEWGRLDFLLHSIAFAPRDDLHGRVVDCSKEGFLAAMEVSCWSFIRMAKLAEPLMKEGGTLFCMTYYGSQMVVEHYGIMGPVKAALESATRYLAAELGPKGIRVHAISPGPLKTRAASGHRPLRRDARPRPGKGPGPKPGLDRRCRPRHRLPRHRCGQADHRRDPLHRRRLPRHRLRAGHGPAREAHVSTAETGARSWMAAERPIPFGHPRLHGPPARPRSTWHSHGPRWRSWSGSASCSCSWSGASGVLCFWIAASSTEARGGVLRRRLIEVQDGDPRPVRREQSRRGEPDSARIGRAGDDGHLAGQKHPFPPLICELSSTTNLSRPFGGRKRVIYSFW